MLNPQHLITFTAVARLKSISRAAEALYVSQPAVSAQLRHLQDVVGEPLYIRQAHGIELTASGKALLQHAELLKRVHAQAEDFVKRLKDVEAGSLYIGSTSTIATYYLPDSVVQFQRAHKAVSVHIDTDSSPDLIQRLDAFDITFIEGPLPHFRPSSQYELIPWVTDEVALVVPPDHPLAVQYPQVVPFAALQDYTMIWREPASGARQTFEQALCRSGIKLPVNIVMTGVDAIKEAVRAGLGIGCASARCLTHAGEDLVSRHLETQKGVCWDLHIIAPVSGVRSHAAQRFLETLHAQAVRDNAAKQDNSIRI